MIITDEDNWDDGVIAMTEEEILRRQEVAEFRNFRTRLAAAIPPPGVTSPTTDIADVIREMRRDGHLESLELETDNVARMTREIDDDIVEDILREARNNNGLAPPAQEIIVNGAGDLWGAETWDTEIVDTSYANEEKRPIPMKLEKMEQDLKNNIKTTARGSSCETCNKLVKGAFEIIEWAVAIEEKNMEMVERVGWQQREIDRITNDMVTYKRLNETLMLRRDTVHRQTPNSEGEAGWTPPLPIEPLARRQRRRRTN